MSEELALQEILGHRRAVLGDEELIAAFRSVVQRRRDELFAGSGLPLDEDRDPRLHHFFELPEQRQHGLALTEDLLFAALPLFFAALQEGVFLVETVFGRHQPLDELAALDGERGIGREHGENLDVVLAQHRRRVTIVDLDDAENGVPLPQRDPDGAADRGAHERLALTDVARRVGGENRGALAYHLAKDAARNGHRAGRRDPLTGGGAYPRQPGDVRAVGFIDVAQHQSDVGSVGNQRENGIGNRDERLFETRASSDALLGAVKRGETARIFFDSGCNSTEILDLPNRDDPSFVGIVGHRHVDRRDRVPRAELDDVTGFERRFVAGPLAQHGARFSANERGAVGRPEIFQHRSRRAEHDSGVLGRDLYVLENEVVARGSPDANELPGRVERPPFSGTRSNDEPKHLGSTLQLAR
jgi:hypothetical protein